MILYEKVNTGKYLSAEEITEALTSVIEKINPSKDILIIPPDYTRIHSYAGKITEILNNLLNEKVTDILPALGTHSPMTENQIKKMFGSIPLEKFRVHDWREDLTTLGIVPGEYVSEVTEGKVNFDWAAQVNKLLVNKKFDLIISVGQVVPHEVIGMANYNKNIFIGTGGKEGINKSHFVGAVYGMERIMGRIDTPVRKILNYASDNFANDLPIIYVLTVIDKASENSVKVKGLFIGDDYETFKHAAELSIKLNFQLLDKPLDKVVVYLDPSEFKSTWLGNKSIYRTRMALADDGELIILAPGVKSFGEDPQIDRLIRKYGYKSTNEILKSVEENDDLKMNLSAAAHLIHGSSEGRFKITYSTVELSKEEIESVNYNYEDYNKIKSIYDPTKLNDGFNQLPNGEEIFYISNPALGLWANKEIFNKSGVK